MLRFVIHCGNADALVCPSCGRVHRYVRMRLRIRNEFTCDCAAIIVVSPDIVHDDTFNAVQ